MVQCKLYKTMVKNNKPLKLPPQSIADKLVTCLSFDPSQSVRKKALETLFVLREVYEDCLTDEGIIL